MQSDIVNVLSSKSLIDVAIIDFIFFICYILISVGIFSIKLNYLYLC
jgi:hypothetical protein